MGGGRRRLELNASLENPSFRVPPRVIQKIYQAKILLQSGAEHT